MVLLRRWAVLPILLLAGCTAKPPMEPIQVAHLLPLTGPDKKAGEDAQHGMLLAVEEVNAYDQRIAGRTVVVRNIDTQGETATVQAQVVRLITLNRVVAFVAAPESHVAEQVVRTAQGYSLPVVVPGDFPPGTGQDGFLSLEATPAARGIALARYAVKELKPRRAVVLTDQRSPVTVALAAAFMQEWPRAATAKLEEWPFRNDTEQIEFPSRLADKSPTLVLFAGSPADFLKLQGRLRDKKATVTLLYGGEDFGADAFQKADGEVLTATVYAPEGLTEKGKAFAKRYEERFHEPPSFAAVQGYDAGRSLFETMQQAKTAAAPKLHDDLLRVESFDSVTGKVVWKDRQAQRTLFVIRVKDGEVKVMDTIVAEEK